MDVNKQLQINPQEFFLQNIDALRSMIFPAEGYVWSTPEAKFFGEDEATVQSGIQDQELQKFLRKSGWDEILKIESKDKLLVPSSVNIMDGNWCFNMLPFGAYLNGKFYHCAVGGNRSYDTAKMMFLPHKFVPPHVLTVANQRVHILLEDKYRPNLFGWASSGDFAPNIDQLLGYLKEIDLFSRYLTEQGFIFDPLKCMHITEDGELFCLPHDSFVQIGQRMIDLPEMIGSIETFNTYYMLRFIEFIVKDVEIQIKMNSAKNITEKQIQRITYNEISGKLKGEFKDFIPYSLPTIGRSTISDEDLTKAVKFIQLDAQLMEMFMAITSKGLYKGNPEDIKTIFLDNLDKFSYVRAPIVTYMTPDLMWYYSKYIQELNLNYIRNYNILYDKLASGPKPKIYTYIAQIYDPLIPELKEFDSLIRATPMSQGKRVDNPILETTAEELEGFTTIGGVELSKNNLAKVFYNTPLAVVAAAGDSIDKPVWMTLEDLTLIQGFFQGLIMPYVLYRGLSDSAFVNLSGANTFLDLYGYYRYYIDKSYVIGKSPVEYLKNMRIYGFETKKLEQDSPEFMIFFELIRGKVHRPKVRGSLSLA